MSNFQCPECGMINIDCGWGNFKTPREIELEKRVKDLEQKLNAQFAEMEEKLTAEENKNFELKENIKTIFTSLIIANHVDIGAIQDTIWVDNYTTLWGYIRIILNMDDEQFEEFEKQALKQMEEVK